MITEGWEYIGAAYALPWVVLGLYGISLWRRLGRIRKKEGEGS